MVADYLFIVRHGETKANKKGIDAGPLDYPLTNKGVKEVSFIAKAISHVKFSAVYSSPVFRAVETAEILAKPHKLKVKKLEELTEAKLKTEYIGQKGRHHLLSDPEAFTETNKDVLNRTSKAIALIKNQEEGNVIVVSHGDVITSLLEGVVERKVITERYYVFHSEPAALSVVDIKSRPFLILYNYHRRLLKQF
jgi:broad specificity phosphatase PhoE